MIEASLDDTINMTGLETSGNHIPDEFIKMLLGIILETGGRAQITYEIIHKGWNSLWCSLLDATQ